MCPVLATVERASASDNGLLKDVHSIGRDEVLGQSDVFEVIMLVHARVRMRLSSLQIKYKKNQTSTGSVAHPAPELAFGAVFRPTILVGQRLFCC